MAFRTKNEYVKERLSEINSSDLVSQKWSSRSFPMERLGKPVRLPTDLYFIETQCPERFIKIGITADVSRRIGDMQMHCPYPLRLLKCVKNAAKMEKDIHSRFAADRITGEWFKRSDELLELIAAL